ncbi:MAG: hypothetical protein RLT05_34690 [Bauldia litoralis]
MPSRPVLLCGSIPLADTDAVLDTVSDTLGHDLARVPDGETGARTNWIAWQGPVFARQAALEPTAERERSYQLRPPLTFKPSATPDDLDFRPLGFADAALASYRRFAERRDAGAFRADARFQVCLPTPYAPVYSFVAYDSQEAVYPVYEAVMLGELADIAAAIPARDLAIQWDVATEMSLFERVFPTPLTDPDRTLIDRMSRLGDAVPDGAELGYHLCYGSMNDRHWKEPRDLGRLVWTSNALARAVSRRIDWIHVPVPIERDDDAYFAPLDDLAVAPETEFYLGLVHHEDGVEGARRRIAAALPHRSDFGIAAECGFGRMADHLIAPLLRLHAEVIKEIEQAV